MKYVTQLFAKKSARIASMSGMAVLLGAAALQVAAAPAGAITSAPYATSVVVLTSATKPLTGSAVTWTATVKSLHTGSPSPTGTVTFTVTGANGAVACASTTPLAASAKSQSQATCTSPVLSASAAPYAVSATYVPDNTALNTGSTGGLNNPQAVAVGTVATVLTASSNPAVTGQPISFTASTTIATGSGTLSGNVTFAGVTCDGGNTVALVGGLAQCQIAGGLTAAQSPLGVTATYGGDPNFTELMAGMGRLHETVGAAAATVTLAANPNVCSGDICQLSNGQSVSFTATAAPAGTDGGAGTPNGNIVFTVMPAGQTAPSKAIPCDDGNSVPLAGGQATCSFANGLSADVYYTVTASLVDPNYSASVATLYEETGMTGTSVSVSVPKGNTAGESIPVTAAVVSTGGGNEPITGTVEFTVCGANDNGSNGCQGGNVPVGSDGTATFIVAGGETPGVYQYYARYLGDTNYLPSATGRRQFTVNQSLTALTVVSSENPAISGDAIAFSAAVVTPSGASGSTYVGPPSGTITFTITDANGGTYTCTEGNVQPIDNGVTDEGVATCFLPPGTLTMAGDYSIDVAYSGDSNYTKSQSKFTETVVPPID